MAVSYDASRKEPYVNNAIAYLDESTASAWERTLYAFLAEKERRSGSLRTVQSYSRMLQDFFGRTHRHRTR